MNILDQFDVSKFTLGSVCGNGHDYNGTGQSLRRIKGRACVECDKEKNKENTRLNRKNCYACGCAITTQPVKRVIDGQHKYLCTSCTKCLTHKYCNFCKQEKPVDDFHKDPRKLDGRKGRCASCIQKTKSRKQRKQRISVKSQNILQSFIGIIEEAEELANKGFYLSQLCPQMHNWKNTGYTLRIPNSGNCQECSKERSNYKYWLKRGSNAKSIADLVAEEQLKHERKEREINYYKQNKEKVKARYRRFYQQNKDKEKLRVKIWKHSNPQRRDFHNQVRSERLRKQSDGSVTREQINRILQSSSKCVYCDESITKETATIDHIVPVSKGGLHSAFNLVACCSRCNAVKNNKSFVEWLEELPSKNREKALRLYLKRYGVEPTQQVLPLVFS